MRSRSPTMKDVAAATGFAPATVSLALRNHHSLPLATRQRIRAAARRLGYRPNPLVSALMVSLRSGRAANRHAVLALVTSHAPGESWRAQRTFAELCSGAETRAAELGYRLEEFALRAPGMTPARFVQMLRTRNIHGLLINPLPHHDIGTIAPMIENHLSGLCWKTFMKAPEITVALQRIRESEPKGVATVEGAPR